MCARSDHCALRSSYPDDLFVTEATFALPVFSHGNAKGEVSKLLKSLRQFPERAHVVGVDGLGKCQRLIAMLREAGFAEPTTSTARSPRAARSMNAVRRLARGR